MIACVSDADVDVCASLLAVVSTVVCTSVSAVVSSAMLSTAIDKVSISDAIELTGVSVVDTLINTAISVEVSFFPFLFLWFIVIPFLVSILIFIKIICCFFLFAQLAVLLDDSYLSHFLSFDIFCIKKGHGISTTTFPQYSVFSRVSKTNTV